MDRRAELPPSVLPRTMRVMLPPGWLLATLIVVLSLWILHSFLQAILAASVTAVASWPLYARFSARWRGRIGPGATSLVFTLAMTVFVLTPLMFAFGALLTETRALLLQIAAADRTGIAVPSGLENAPWVGPWAAALWDSQLAHPGALEKWTQRANPGALLAWVQSLGQFMVRHAFIIGFTILLLFFLYQEGETLGRAFKRVLRHRIGDRAEDYVDLATRAVRASVNSMLVVSLFDGVATGLVYALTGVPNALVWAAVTGLLALVPFVAYAAVAALTLQLALTASATPPLVVLAAGCLVLFFGDKVVRPVLASGGVRLGFVWILMGCLGGFEALGVVGLVVGPVVLTLVRELWEQHVRDLAGRDLESSTPRDEQHA